MKKLLSCFILCLFAFSSNAQQKLQEQSLWPNGDELDFGHYEARDVEKFDSLYLHNPTTEPIVIENIRASCGCTAVDWPKRPIEPLETVAIPIAFRCTKGGDVVRHLDVFLSHLRKKERIYVYAECPKL